MTAVTCTTIRVPDMHCAACAGKVRRALEGGDGILDLHFNTVRRQVLIDHRADVPPRALLQWIEQAGFSPALGGTELESSEGTRELLIRFGVATLCMMQVMMVTVALYAGVFTGIEEAWRRLLEFSALLFTIPVMTYCAVPFFRAALRGGRGLGMDTTIALAITVAFSASLWNTLRGAGDVWYDAVTMFTCLMLGTRYLDARLRDRLAAGDRLSATLPRRVLRIENGNRHEIAAAFVQAGDHLFIREGELLCVDGVLDAGNAWLDESSLTGESAWRRANPGEALLAGTWNRGPAFEMRASGHMDASRIARIDAFTERALVSKGRLATLSDRVAALFVPAVLVLAATAVVFWLFVEPGLALPAALAVLVVSCPCALALAAPAALHAAVSKLRQAGILVKDAAVLERLHRIDRVCFDKTGTLTDPSPVIAHIDVCAGFDRATVLRLAGALQQHVSHPLARAFPVVSDLRAEDVSTAAQGVIGTVDGYHVRVGSAGHCGLPAASEPLQAGKPVWLTVNGEPAACFTLTHALRPDAVATIRHLKALGLRVYMRSGDRDEQCAAVASQLDIDYRAAQTPEDKALEMADHHGSTLFVGDGINDMPALATAAVSVATLETTDFVKSKADAFLLAPNLGALVDLLVIGRTCHRIVYQNLVWAGLYNVIAIPLAMAAIAPPWSAAIGMSLSSLIVLANATRILGTTPGRHANRLEV